MDTSTAPPTPKLNLSEWVQNRPLRYLSTDAGTTKIAFQDWRSFKEAFAPELVIRAVRETEKNLGSSVKICSDPFGGSGTTPLACQFLGLQSVTIEINPFLADLIEAKLSFYDPEMLTAAFAEVVERSSQIVHEIDDPFPNAPLTFVEPGDRGRFLFFRPIASKIAAYREAIREIACTITQRFFRVM